jgi:hypothetical protein
VKRLVWLSLGAAGGILAYRKGSALLNQAREQGIVLTSTQVVESGRQILDQAQRVVSRDPKDDGDGFR